MDFLGYEMNDEQVGEDESCDDEEDDNVQNMCDTCEKEFQTYWQYQKHMSEHKTCGLDGCTFTAHEKIIEKHIKMQHSSGLYDKIRNVITPEDIAKWVAERKKKFPSKENVAKRYQQQEEMLKRGEKLTRNSGRFDRKNKTRFALNRRNNRQPPHNKKKFTKRRNQQQHKAPAVSLLNDKSDWNGELFPFRGTGQLYGEEEPTEEDVTNDFDDSEWLENNSNETKASSSKIVLSNALGSLMSAYNSSDDSETEDLAPKNEVVKAVEPKLNSNLVNVPQLMEKDTGVSDDEPPLEQKIERIETPNVGETNTKTASVTQDARNDKFKRKRRRTKRRRSESSNKQNESVEPSTNTEHSRKRFNNQKGYQGEVYKKRRVTLLERLLESEILHERNVLLQCVRYIVANNFFDKKISIKENNEVVNVPESSLVSDVPQTSDV